VKWLALMIENGERHVIPLDDLRDHAESAVCWCRPFDEEGVWVHNSMDRREFLERKEVIPN